MRTVHDSDPDGLRVLHILNLDTIGGVERAFVDFLALPQQDDPQNDCVLVTGGRVHPEFRRVLRQRAARVEHAKRWHGFKLPRRPRALRLGHEQRVIDRTAPAVAVFWNRIGDAALFRRVRRAGARGVYYEHGAAWLCAVDGGSREVVREADGILCNTRAARRVIELRFATRRPMEVLPYGLRPAFDPARAEARSLGVDRPVRLGVAARLVPLKGVGVALHALKILEHATGTPFELHIAGTGSLRNFLSRTADRLGVAGRVFFRGVVLDMAAFYRSIDLLLVPSVREPFGLVLLEAAACGCPAVCSRIDGCPEAVSERGAISLQPTLDLRTGLEFGGRPGDFPPFVYEPTEDRLVEPRFLDPALLAGAIGRVVGDREAYASLSRGALDHARAWPRFGAYGRALRQAFAGVVGAPGRAA